MASIRKRKLKTQTTFQVRVNRSGVKEIVKSFYTLTEAKRWARHIEKLTTKRTRDKHDDIKSPRYWNSIGRINERRIKDKKRRIEAESSSPFVR